MKIGGLQKLSLIDFPGRVACVVFTRGCNLRCPWCHNPDLIETTVPDGESGLTWREVLGFLESRTGKLDGVVFTGGEPLLQPDFSLAVRDVRDRGYAVKMDTNGTLPDKLSRLLDENPPDYIAMDLKAGPDALTAATGVPIGFESIKRTLNMITSSGLDYEIRTTLVPGIHTLTHFKNMLPLIKGVERYVLQTLSGYATFQPAFQSVRPLSSENLKIYKNLAESVVNQCIVRI